ncbi:hypothetical protein LX32DRAFT_436000 [Colletotrichum zoysiae]|uniref:C2H2-type domain-containing protein n=1 Tax=Colletotrichum zoysiae TaxID=1216348 RepID=A0AAD9M391_9PEZI|nr:hypothetical protein LX32DRAFT_436000 [Colletotrichum zoysiae]
MSPPSPEKEKKPVAGDPSESDQDSRRRDGSPRESDPHMSHDHLPSDEAQEEQDISETPLAESTPPRFRTRGRLSRFLINPLSATQDGNSDEMPRKKPPASAVASQDNSRHRSQLPSTDHSPGVPKTPSSVQLPEIWNKTKKKMKRSLSNRASHNGDNTPDASVAIGPGSLSTAEAEQKTRRAELLVSKEFDSGNSKPQLPSNMPVGLETDAAGELVNRPDKPSPSLMEASRPTTPGSQSGGNFDSNSSGAENEVYQEADDPSKGVHRFMVDRVMSSFMSWLDTKLKVKNEDESLDPEQSLLAITPCVALSQEESDARPPPTSVPLIAPPSTSALSSTSGIFDGPLSGRRSDAAFKPAPLSPPRPPPPPPSLLAPGAADNIPDKGKKVGIVPRLARSQYRAPDASMAALPPSSPSAQLTNLRQRPAPTAPRAVVAAAAPVPAPKKRAALTYHAASAKGLSTRSPGKRSSKHDRPQDENDEEEGNSDGDGNRPPRAKLSKIHEDRGDGAKLACPFFKHNPRKYKNQRPCCGPGWDRVHRIKEHIYRKHSLPKFSCPRCSHPFETQADLQTHARSADACEVRGPEFLDGITQDQEKMLRSRKKTSAKELTEAEKWTQAYMILFPDAREREIPSPYYSIEDAGTNLGGYEDYLRRELPPLVRRQLENEIERELSFVEQGMKQKVIEIARNLQFTLFKGYQQLEKQEQGVQDPPSVDAPASQPDGPTSSATDTSPSTMTTSGMTPDIPDPLDLFSNYTHPDFDFTFLSEFPFPEEQQLPTDPSLDFGFTPSFQPKQPATTQPGLEFLDGQQLDMPYYELEGNRDNRGHPREAGSLGYAP